MKIEKLFDTIFRKPYRLTSLVWLMKLNFDKCKVMHVGKKNPRTMYFMTDTANGQVHELAKTDCERGLGVYASSDLKSSEQVDQAVSKANSMFGMLKRTFRFRGVRM